MQMQDSIVPRMQVQLGKELIQKAFVISASIPRISMNSSLAHREMVCINPRMEEKHSHIVRSRVMAKVMI